MTTYFFDTSALVSRYHDRTGTARVDEIIEDGESDVVVSTLAVIETVSAMRRTYNRGDVSHSEMEQLIGVFSREALAEFVLVPLEESVMTFSFDLVLKDDLRTLDSLQLSAGVALHEDAGAVFVTADRNLASIARKEGSTPSFPVKRTIEVDSRRTGPGPSAGDGRWFRISKHLFEMRTISCLLLRCADSGRTA
jgi:predicted nucleic acid-binding protein